MRHASFAQCRRFCSSLLYWAHLVPSTVPFCVACTNATSCTNALFPSQGGGDDDDDEFELLVVQDDEAEGQEGQEEEGEPQEEERHGEERHEAERVDEIHEEAAQDESRPAEQVEGKRAFGPLYCGAYHFVHVSLSSHLSHSNLLFATRTMVCACRVFSLFFPIPQPNSAPPMMAQPIESTVQSNPPSVPTRQLKLRQQFKILSEGYNVDQMPKHDSRRDHVSLLLQKSKALMAAKRGQAGTQRGELWN